MKKGRYFCLFLLLLSMTAGCGPVTNSGRTAVAVDSFATYFFNWRFREALPFTDSLSRVWLNYAAAQVHQADIDLLNDKQPAAVEILEVENHAGDTTATATVRVSDFLRMDTIGKAARPADEAVFRLDVVKREGKWRVRMEGLPRSEKRSRD